VTTEHVFTHTVHPEDDHKKISQVLALRLGMSRKTLLRLRRSGEVRQNGVLVYMRETVRAGDQLILVLREEREQSLLPQSMPLDIAYEDEHLVVVNKPAFMVVHPTKGYLDGTLANALLAYYQGRGQEFIIRSVHRLDRDTSGLLLIAKNPHVQARLTEQHHTGEWQKSYLAVVSGVLPEAKGRISAPIKRVGNGSRARVISPLGQDALTLWERLSVGTDTTLVKATLVTGRTHQIRVHFAHLGHPLVGDEVYGTASPLIARQALHAAWLSFRHPERGEQISLFAPPPADFAALLTP